MENRDSIGELLVTHGLKRTPIRIQILELFIHSSFAQSASDILQQMNKAQDRVTVYRALSAFEKTGIIHKASEDGHGIKYAMHKDLNHGHGEMYKHAHFVCNQCNKTFCLNDIKIPEIDIPDDFMVSSANYILNGICGSCNNENS